MGSQAKALLLFILPLLMAVGCGRPQTESKVVKVTGASTVYPIVSMAAEPLKRLYRIRVEAQAGGSTRGFENTLSGQNDLGAMARDLTSEEAAQVNVFPIAYDGVGIAVHEDNTLKAITTAQLQAIYRGQVTNWRDMGCDDAEIVVINKAEGHATLETFLKHTGLDRSELKVDVIAGDNAQVIRTLANTPNAIGYVSVSEVIQAAENGMPVRLITLDGVAPNLSNIANRSYPIFRTLYLVSKNQPKPAAQLLIDFLRSEEGKQIIRQGRYVPL